MAGGPIQIWNEWAIQILILLSFALQIFLFLFARTRRHGPSAVLKILLWLAYLMADSTAVYTLGHLSMYGFPREQKLAVLWAPFLLVHLGSQDTITAYALEDNKLWPRHLLNLGVQAFAVAYVLYKHIAEIPTLLGLVTGLMFVVGLIKYGERIWALKCATLDNMLRSIREYRPLPTYYSLLLPPQGLRAEERDEEEFLLFAHAMLPLCKGAMADVPVTLFRSRSDGIRLYNSYRWNWNWKATLKVVEMELSLVYDILYTKAVVIHNWYGYSIRVFSLLATIVVFILLQLSGNKDDYSKVDVAITYILLVAAFLLDLASVLGALGSTWTCNLLWTRGWSQLGLVILSLRRHLNTARGNRGWSGSIGQFNLLRFSSRDKTKLSIRMAKMMGLEDLWNNWRHTETVVISEDVKDLVFHHVWQVLKKIADPRWEYVTLPPRPYEEQPTAIMPINNGAGFAPEPYKETAMRRMKLAQALSFDAQLQEVILTWHICTDVFLLRSGTAKDMDAASSTYLKAIKALSNYMVFLIAVRPDTIAGLELRSMFETTRDALDKVWSKSGQNQYPTAEEKLAHFMQNGCSHVIVQRGNTYASMLLGLLPIKDDMFMPHYCCVYSADRDLWKHLMPDLELSPDGDVCTGGDVFDIPKVLVLIFDAWVRLLIFASVRCSRDAHARQINRGGELTTVVWLMQEHAAMFLKLTEEELFSRNRYELEEKNQVMSD